MNEQFLLSVPVNSDQKVNNNLWTTKGTKPFLVTSTQKNPAILSTFQHRKPKSENVEYENDKQTRRKPR